MEGEWGPFKNFPGSYLIICHILDMRISTEDRKSRQNRVLYAENRNRIGVTYIGVQKSPEETSISKVHSIGETSGKFVNFYFRFVIGIWGNK